MAPETAARLRELPKGDALTTAQLAGIMAAKHTAELIPLCHPLPLSHVSVELSVGDASVEIVATAETTAQTGVEMEALTAASVAALDGLRHGQGGRQGHDRERGTAAREDEGAGVRAAVLTVSDGVSEGTREDRSGDLLVELLEADGYEVERRVVPDERGAIGEALTELAERSAVVLTTGGTGLGPRDVTPEATIVAARPRGARDRGGDPRRLDREDAARAALARPGRRDRLDARRQPPRLARRLPRRLRGAAACARPRGRAARGRGRRRTGRHDVVRLRRRAPAALRVARQDRAHAVRAAVRVRRRVPGRRRRPERARPALDHGRDGRRAVARDGR